MIKAKRTSLNSHHFKLIGKTIGRWSIIQIVKNDRNIYHAKSKCECGSLRYVQIAHLKSGKSVSCGCYKVEVAKSTIGENHPKYKHGGYSAINPKHSKNYIRWLDMLRRCQDPNSKDYQYYGGRGIKVGKRWQCYEHFFEDMGYPPTSKHTLDRMNNDKGYNKSNCKWSTRKQQANNRRPKSQRCQHG